MTGTPDPVPAPPLRRLAQASTGERIAAGLVALGVLAVLVTAASLTPADSGIGTHTQLGMADCGWMVKIGRPCPTCGMTTAFAHAANLSPAASLVAQPFAAFAVLFCAAVFWGAAHMALFASRLGHLFGRLVLQPRVLWPLGAAWAASWVYKVLVTPSPFPPG